MQVGMQNTGTDSAGGYRASRVSTGHLSWMKDTDALERSSAQSGVQSWIAALADAAKSGEPSEGTQTAEETQSVEGSCVAERGEATKIYQAAISGKKNLWEDIRRPEKVPYGYLAKDGVIHYNGVCFVCDEKTNSICLGDMTDQSKVLTIALSGGGHLKVNRDNLGDLSRAVGMFSPEDLNRIMRAIALDTKLQAMKQEIDDMESNVGNELGAETEASGGADGEDGNQ